ncbi:putative F-box protein At1g33020 [Eutrema salsugineum]|uniref:putative F-box protein At1g33020 n=1 Tax=Eutrema salsugineum TaxID=72664 RepID=UPI000CED2557|nr:putative F-box protein At1g33020 [Eutrema salsugineum]
MNREEGSESFPVDLIPEILSRLPAKSIGRFLCVSKLWGSILHRPDFNELFLTRSLARPRLLFAIQGVVTVHVICNPSTRQCVSLPKLRTKDFSRSFLGFDPIDKQFKVLCMANPNLNYGLRILTLGSGKLGWRKIKPPLTHHPADDSSQQICINGVLYYFALMWETLETHHVIVCFDVKSEKFKSIDAASSYDWGVKKLINYKGKLGVISWHYTHSDESDTFEFLMWVLEDVEKQEWSKYVYTLPCKCNRFGVAGMTASGEIVLWEKYTFKPSFDVLYFNPRSNSTICSVEIQGNNEVFDMNRHSVCTFVDHVETLKFNIMNTSPPTRTEA